MLTLRRMAAAFAVVLSVLGVTGATTSAGPAPAPDLELNLTAECAVGDTLYWRVTNDNDVAVDFTWKPAGGSPSASITAAPNDRTYFTSADGGGANTTIIEWDNPADGSDSKTKAHNNQQCVYHVDLAKDWNGADVPDLDGATVLTATVSSDVDGSRTATCTSDDGELTCVYSTGDDLHVPFGETYAVAESVPDGWTASAGVGEGFTGIDGFDDSALPGDLVYDVNEGRYCQSDPLADPPFDLEKFCTHTVTNEFEPPSESTTTTTTAPPQAPATFELSASPVCLGDFPYVRYSVSGSAVTGDTVQLRFLFNGEEIQNLGERPLTGEVFFPGASAEPDWPGWTRVPNADGVTWIRDTTTGEAAWRNGVVLEATVNETETVAVAYPDGPCQDPVGILGGAGEPTVPPTPTVPLTGELPATGSSDSGAMALIALTFLGGGAALIGLARRRTVG